jgi:ribosome-associated toxin RatA of RatAB toxin-antitoxin module
MRDGRRSRAQGHNVGRFGHISDTGRYGDCMIEVQQAVSANPALLYSLVSDVTRMSEWSPETTACRWISPASEASVGARFRGSNRDGWRRWFTTCSVITADPGHRFAFDVDLGPFPIARWTYDFVANEAGSLVTETWEDRRAPWMVRISPIVMGVPDREQHNRDGMRVTLERLRAYAEAAAPSPG